jgi:competence protein ComEC
MDSIPFFMMSHLHQIIFGTILIFCLYASQSWIISDGLMVKFLDIGQGDSVLIQTPQGRTVLIDGGPGTTVLERLGEESSFWQKSFDLLVLTHPDLDHLEGLLEVIKRYEVRQVLMTGVNHSSALYRAFLDELVDQDISVSIADPSLDWVIDQDVYLDILGPSSPHLFEEADNLNDTSVVIKLIYGDTTMLLPGDAEEDQEMELLRSGFDLSADILKSGHHGSTTSSHPDFLQAVQAGEVIIQAGRENPFGHPHVETLLRYDERGMAWWSTGELGTTTMSSNGEHWTLVE